MPRGNRDRGRDHAGRDDRGGRRGRRRRGRDEGRATGGSRGGGAGSARFLEPSGARAMKVSFADLRAMHDEVRAEIEAAWRELEDRSAFVGGPAVADFEHAFADYCEVPHAVGVGSGTDALRIALQAVGIRPGDLILTVPHTFIATVEAIVQAGASPVFIDIEPDSYTMDPV